MPPAEGAPAPSQPPAAPASIPANEEAGVATGDTRPLLDNAEAAAPSTSAAEPEPVAQGWRGALRRAFARRTSAAASDPPAADDPEQGLGAGSVPGTAPTIPVISEQAGRTSSSGEIEGARPPPVRAAGSTPVCLICLENLAADDFASGRAITLECQCRGDLALRHRDCAIKWAQIKDDGRGGVPTCELCKHPVRNLPALPPRPHLLAHVVTAGAEDGMDPSAAYIGFAPSQADLVFDCVRVCWVAMIVSILFFSSSLGVALWTGLIAGLAYSMMVRLLYRQHFAAMHAYAEQQAALRMQPPTPAPQPPRQVGISVV